MTLLLNLLLLLAPAAGTSNVYLPKGTIIKLHLSQPASSETAVRGGHVEFKVVEDVKVGNTIVIPKGSSAQGAVSTAISGKAWGYAGIGVRAVSVRAPSGVDVPVIGTTERGGNTQALISTDTEVLAATESQLALDQLVPADSQTNAVLKR